MKFRRLCSVNEYSAIKSVFPQASITHVPDCGHWVHFEKPNEFLQIVKDYLTRRWLNIFENISRNI